MILIVTSFGRLLISWLEVSTNEAMIRYLSLTVVDITESLDKAIAALKKILKLWLKLFLIIGQPLIIF